MSWGGIDWIHLAQDRNQWRAVVNMEMNAYAPDNIWDFLSSCTTSEISGRSQLHRVSLLIQKISEEIM
jgi:hypothetical protein